jgi:hypothetical protein
VTLEEGVRVFRPLPRHDRVIINPNGTPLQLGFYEMNSYSSNYNNNSYYPGAGAYPFYGGNYGYALPLGRRHRFHHHHRPGPRRGGHR